MKHLESSPSGVATPTVTLFTDVTQNYYHASSIYAGLVLLARQNSIRFSLTLPRTQEERRLVADPLTVCLKLSLSDRPQVTVAVDLHDQSDVFAPEALETADIYLKRSFKRINVVSLPRTLATKVLPFGLNYACQTPASTLRVFSIVGPALLRERSRGIQRILYQLALPSLKLYEQSPKSEVAAKIIFQTRVWEEHEAQGQAKNTNERRVSLIRALRSALGSKFVGGLVPTRLAMANYPSDVTSNSSRRTRYISASKANLIGIYTHGLWGSTAFKLSEYLAASQCIVAEPPHDELPLPLQPGKNYLPFETIDQCVDACRRLLEDGELVKKMRQANHEYYVSQVEPSARMWRVVQLGLGRELIHE